MACQWRRQRWLGEVYFRGSIIVNDFSLFDDGNIKILVPFTDTVTTLFDEGTISDFANTLVLVVMIPKECWQLFTNERSQVPPLLKHFERFSVVIVRTNIDVCPDAALMGSVLLLWVHIRSVQHSSFVFEVELYLLDCEISEFIFEGFERVLLDLSLHLMLYL